MVESQNAFDVVIIGAGHAGCEAALATAKLGLRTLVVTTNSSRIGYMSCNPSIGGLAKGHIVREIDVLGGAMGWVADQTCLQAKRLNASKGAAVRGTRMQVDKEKYSRLISELLHNQPNLQILESEVKELIVELNKVKGVVLQDESKILARSVIVTTGTFMNGLMHVGRSKTAGGRVGDRASVGLSDQLKGLGFPVRRLKTGTPARLIRESIDWGRTQEQWGDKEFFPFSLKSEAQPVLPQIPCYISRTTQETHEIIQRNLHLSAMYGGEIEGTGPRYCPSIEDKIVRFSQRDSHQTFLEPESLETNLIYLQGISTSLPSEVQDEFLKTIPGLENVKVARYGYAVEYDFIEPQEIRTSLESKIIGNLFLAGQINGTSGYEEAGVQGLLAGINCVQKHFNREEFILERHEAYAGVLMDDLVTKGTREPYRMFTSRAEHRLVLREDNVIERLYQHSLKIGLATEQLLDRAMSLKEKRKKLTSQLAENFIYPTQATQDKLLAMGTPVLKKSIRFDELLRRSEISCLDLAQLGFEVERDPMVYEPVEIEVKYGGYIAKQNELIEQAKESEALSLPEDFDFSSIAGLSSEEVEKLSRIRPRSLGQAQRISGVNPSAVQAILINLKKRKHRESRREV